MDTHADSGYGCRFMCSLRASRSCALAALLIALANDAHAQTDPASGTPAAAAPDASAPDAPAPDAPAPDAPAPVTPAPVAPAPVSPPATSTAETAEASASVPSDKPSKKGKRKESAAEKRMIAITEAGTFGVKGRVLTELRFRRAERTIVDAQGMPRPTDVDSLDIALDSARFSLLYQAPAPWLQAELEIEIADPDQAELKDAYILADGGPPSAKAGNFKPPTSAIELESAWKLPVADRGFIHDLLEGWLAASGRRPGIQLAYEHDDGIEPALIVGAFQGSVLIEQIGDDRDLELIEEANLDAQTWVARAQVELGKVDVGVFFAQRVGSPAPLQTQHYPLTGADITFDEEFGELGLRAWVDAHLGESWYAHASKSAEEGEPWFLALRAILAARYGGTSDDTFYAELHVSLGMLDPDLDVTADWAHELATGFNVGLWDRARLTLEGYLHDTSRNFPDSYFGGPRGQTLGLTLQAGVAF